MLKDIFKFFGFFILGIFGGIFGSQILWPYFVERPLFLEYRLESSPIYLTETREIKIQENIAIQDAIEEVEKTVVGIKTETKKGKILEGSGFILTSDGLIVTLAELVPENSSSSFFIGGTFQKGQILKRDLKENLALLKIEGRNFPTVGFGDMGKMRLGQRVFFVGIIFEKGIQKKIVDEGIVKYFNEDSIQTNISGKNNLAGSPLFNIEGNLLGLNKIDEDGKIASIPVSKIKSFAGF